MKSPEYELQEELDDEGVLALEVDQASSGVRLDHLLVQSIPDTSRSRITSSIRSGLILVDGEVRKPSYKLKVGELISGVLYEPPAISVAGEEIEFPILYEDDSLLVLSKPPGLVVHPGSGNSSGTLVNGLVHHCASIADVGDEIRPGIVHRLDKDTSGLMVVAKSDHAHRCLADAFKERQVKKEYLALVHGSFDRQAGRIVEPIGRHPVNRQKMAVRESGGRYAASNWQVLEEYETRYTLVSVLIETGRTHQIRVHMAHIKHPVAGDTLYGPHRNNRIFPRQMLHAWKLSFNHPDTGRSMSFCASMWDDMQQICDSIKD